MMDCRRQSDETRTVLETVQTPQGVWVFCDDGSLWRLAIIGGHGEWRETTPLPGTPRARKAEEDPNA